MDKDYKHRIAGGAMGDHHAPPGWLWFLAGVLAGGFFAGLVCLKTGPLQPTKGTGQPQPSAPPAVSQTPASTPLPLPPKSAPPPKSEPPSPPPAPEKGSKAAEPRFDFYTILPEREEVVNTDRTKEAKAKPADPGSRPLEVPPTAAPATEGEASYMLQLGSFKRTEDAQRRQAELMRLMITAEIQTVTINDGDVYHRVRSGPYSAENAALLGEKLRELGISSLTIRTRE